MGKSEKSPHLRLRIQPDLLARVKAAAKENSNTTTGEIIDRLEKSFLSDDKVADVLGDARHAPIFRLLAGIIGVAELQSDKRWDQDRQTFLRILQQTGETLQSLSKGTATLQEKASAAAAFAGGTLHGGQGTKAETGRIRKDKIRSIVRKLRKEETTK